MTSKNNGQNHLSTPFHRLTEEELRHWHKDKLIATTGYLLAIRKIKAPPGVSFTIPNVQKFCEDWGIARSAFYRAVDYLRDKGYFTWEATHGIILSDSKKVISLPTEKKCPTDGTQLQERDTKSHPRDTESHPRDTESHSRDTESHSRDTNRSKPLHSKDKSASQIYTDKTDIQTLSDLPVHEREDFEKFVREEYLRTEGKKIRSFTAFVQREHFQEWYALWKNRPDAVKALQNALWESDERHQEWLDKIRILGFMGFICENGFKDLERLAFYEWAEEKGIIWEAEL